MMHNWDGSWGVGAWLLMGSGMLVFWALVVGGIVWLVRNASSNRPTVGSTPGVPRDNPAGAPRPSAQEILDERYARGEISDEEYRSRRDILAHR